MSKLAKRTDIAILNGWMEGIRLFINLTRKVC